MGVAILMKNNNRMKTMYERCFKRELDIFCAVLGLAVLWPIMLALCLLIKIKLGSPVIFKQERPGLNEKIFILYKFRTMTDETDDMGNPLSDEMRLTKFGRALRSTSLDELPELWNILKGDMSLVGPRPLRTQYLEHYSPKEHHRHDVRPGLSGEAQINGRSNLNWEKRFDLDINYIENISFKKDVSIILKTIKKVLQRSEITCGEDNQIQDFDVERKNNAIN